MCHKYIFKILTIQFVGMSRNSEYDKKYGTLRNVLPYTVHIKQYSKHMVTPQIGCHLGCQEMFYHIWHVLKNMVNIW